MAQQRTLHFGKNKIRNVLVDAEGDIFVVDAEIKQV